MVESSKAAYDIWKRNLGSPKYVAGPMVEMSELPFRELCRQYGTQLCFTPMFHASKFVDDEIYRNMMMVTCEKDRPLIVQFCANDAETFARAAELVAPYCDGVDLNLGCPQVIAKRGHYGSFLQDDWDLIRSMLRTATERVQVPISCKLRILPDTQRTLAYAQMMQQAGAKFITVHGRTREQKGHATGLANWDLLKLIKENVTIPVIANGNILNLKDVHRCLQYTGVDAVMSAEAILQNPALFSGQKLPVWEIASQLLQLCTLYPIQHGHIRTHLFRIFAHCLPEFEDLQSALGQAKTMEELIVISEELSSQLKNLAGDIISESPTDSMLPSGGAKHQETSATKSEGKLDTDTGIPSSMDHGIEMDKCGPERMENVRHCEENSRTLCDEMSEFHLEEKEVESISSNSSANQNSQECDAENYMLPIWICHARPRRKLVAKHSAEKGDGSSDNEPESTATSHKEKRRPRSEKKRLMRQKKIEGQKLRRKKTKDERKERQHKEKMACEVGEASGNVSTAENYVSKRLKAENIRRRLTESLQSGLRVCIDLSVEALMSKKECSKMAQQLGRVYGCNRQAEHPFHVFFSGLNKSGFLYQECVRKNAGFENYLVDMEERSHSELFSPADIVCLSPDSPNILQSLEENKVYVIGGLIDEHVRKGVTCNRASKANFQTAQLPIDTYMERAPQGTYRKELTVNQVFEILLLYSESGDWRKALAVGVPARQGFIVKKEAEHS